MKLRLISLLCILTIFLSGCEFLNKIRAALWKQTEQTVQSVNEKVGAVGEQINKTAESVKQKVQDVTTAAEEVQKAADQIGEAVDAVRKIGKETSPSLQVQSSPSASPSFAPNLKDAK